MGASLTKIEHNLDVENTMVVQAVWRKTDKTVDIVSYVGMKDTGQQAVCNGQRDRETPTGHWRGTSSDRVWK